MKQKTHKWLSLALAGGLQIAPLLRTALPTLQAVISSPTAAFVLQWIAGGVAFFGYHAISSASSISVSPATATIGTPYSGTLTYAGTHSGSVSCMNVSNVCLSPGSTSIGNGLTLTYSSGHTATITGTPTGSAGTIGLGVHIYKNANCGSGDTDYRTTSLILAGAAGGGVAPNLTVPPQPVIAQVGADVLLSCGATGNPAPTYYWKQAITVLAASTNNYLQLTNIQLTNAGLYSVQVSNASGSVSSNVYVTVCLSPGSNILALDFTNYCLAGSNVTLVTAISNVNNAINTYQWYYNNASNDINGSYPSTPTWALTNPITAVKTSPSTFSMQFNSVLSNGTVIVPLQTYDSYWQFGYLPIFTNQPSPVSVGSGSNATFSTTIAGGNFCTLLWYQNGTNLVGTTTNLAITWNPTSLASTKWTNLSFTLSNVTSGSAGTYTAVATNFWGGTTSAPVALTVTSSLSVSAPVGVTNYVGKNISLSVTPTGTSPFGYQWQKGAVAVGNGGNISGATTNVLTFTSAVVTNSGNYSVIVTNTSGSVTSAVAAVSVVALPQFTIGLGPNVSLNAGSALVGSQYVIQVSSNLNGGTWTPLLTNNVPGTGIISFTDTNVSSGQRYYRAQFPQ